MPGVRVWLTRDHLYMVMASSAGLTPQEIDDAWWVMASDAFAQNAFWWDASEPWSRRDMAVHVEIGPCPMRAYRELVRGAGHMHRHMMAAQGRMHHDRLGPMTLLIRQ